MRFRESFAPKLVKVWAPALALLAAVVAVTGVVSCGGSSNSSTGPQTASITVTLTDPPSCKFPIGAFEHVYVSIRSVQAHTSTTANDDTAVDRELTIRGRVSEGVVAIGVSSHRMCGVDLSGFAGRGPMLTRDSGTYRPTVQVKLLLSHEVS